MLRPRALLFGIVLLLPSAAWGAPATVTSSFPLATQTVSDLDGDGAADVVLVGLGGEVRVWRRTGTGKELAGPFGDLVLPEPKRSLLWIGDLGDGREVLAVLDPKGLTIHTPGEDGGFSGPGSRAARRASFRLRIGRPAFAPIFRDINADGRPDLLVPGTGPIARPQDAENCQIWLNEGPRGTRSAVPAFRRVAIVNAVLRDSRTIAGRSISDRYESVFRIPALDFRDVNGDGRQDLVVVDDDRRAFHLQQADGTIPPEPDVVLDLSIFRDTTPEGSIRPGRILAGGGDAQLTTTDLNGDDIPDYVVAQGRKIWIFLGSRDGPRFTDPAAVFRVTEDVSALLVLPLDDQGGPDLLILRILIPSVASIVSGLFSELEVEISATGYASVGTDRVFSEKPAFKGSMTVVLPDVVEILRNPGALLDKFKATESNFRRTAYGDFDGDGAMDIAMLSEDGSRVDTWRLAGGVVDRPSVSGLGSLFFGEKERRWSIEEVLEWLSGVARDRAKQLTGGRPPDGTIPVRDRARFDLTAFLAADTTGDGRDEIILIYRDRTARTALVDLH